LPTAPSPLDSRIVSYNTINLVGQLSPANRSNNNEGITYTTTHLTVFFSCGTAVIFYRETIFARNTLKAKGAYLLLSVLRNEKTTTTIMKRRGMSMTTFRGTTAELNQRVMLLLTKCLNGDTLATKFNN